ncbi:hypothetical protein D3C78_1502630 [compost metagenome]
MASRTSSILMSVTATPWACTAVTTQFSTSFGSRVLMYLRIMPLCTEPNMDLSLIVERSSRIDSGMV